MSPSGSGTIDQLREVDTPFGKATAREWLFYDRMGVGGDMFYLIRLASFASELDLMDRAVLGKAATWVARDWVHRAGVERGIRIQGGTGIEWEGDVKGVTALIRAYARDRNLYVLIVGGPEQSGAVTGFVRTANSNEFLDSFRFLDPMGVQAP